MFFTGETIVYFSLNLFKNIIIITIIYMFPSISISLLRLNTKLFLMKNYNEVFI